MSVSNEQSVECIYIHKICGDLIFLDQFIFHVHMPGKSGTSLIFTSLERWIYRFERKTDNKVPRPVLDAKLGFLDKTFVLQHSTTFLFQGRACLVEANAMLSFPGSREGEEFLLATDPNKRNETLDWLIRLQYKGVYEGGIREK